MAELKTIQSVRERGRIRRHWRIRRRVAGTADRPRLVVHRSHLHLYAQVVDDRTGRTLLTVGTTAPTFRAKAVTPPPGSPPTAASEGRPGGPKPGGGVKGGNIDGAKVLGELVAQAAKAKGITQVAFDRGGYRYHGRIQAFAESARQHGLVF